MTIKQKLNILAAYKNITQAELAQSIGMSPQNFNQKIKRESFSQEELEKVAEACGAKYTAVFELPDGTKI